MKKLATLFTIVSMILVFTLQPAFAQSNVITVDIEELPDGSRFVTVIEDVPTPGIQPFDRKTETKSKTIYYENSAGKSMWYIRVTGTFTYGDGTARCTSVTPSAASLDSNWKVSNITGGKSGNKATATATGTHYENGIARETKTKTVTLTCGPTGMFY